MTWQTCLIGLFGALVIFSAAYLLVHEWIERKKHRRAFRITPKYTVGSDCK